MGWSDDATTLTNELFMYVGNLNDENSANAKTNVWPTIIKLPTPTPTPTPTPNPNWENNFVCGESQGDYTANCIAISSDGKYVAVGARGSDGSNQTITTTYYGSVRVFQDNSNTSVPNYVQVGNDIDTNIEGTQFATTLDIDENGTTLVVGAYHTYAGSLGYAGAIHIYKLEQGSTWVLDKTFNGSANKYLGSKVCISADGNTIAGLWSELPLRTDNAKICIYKRDSSGWSSQPNKIDIGANTLYSDRTMAMSKDGNVIVSGVPDR